MRGCEGRAGLALHGCVFSFDRMGMVLGRRCFAVMDRAAHYREQANHARRLARAAWQLDLADMLRHLAKDYDEVAEDIEAAATEIDDDDERRLRASGPVLGSTV